MNRLLYLPALLLLSTHANANPESIRLKDLPAADSYCLDAQRVVVRTNIDVDLTLHDDFNSFVKSKAIIDGPDGKPAIQQYNWRADDGRILGISCKLKNTDHLNMTFGPGSAGPEGACQEMNRQVLALLGAELGLVAYSRFRAVLFHPDESPGNPDNPGMTGPEWLKPFTLAETNPGNDRELLIKTKGFVVEFSDPRYSKAPARFRGVHYCHFIAPQHLKDLLQGNAKPPTVIGKNPLEADLQNSSGPGTR